MQPPDPDIVARVSARLAQARSALFITGAGISADSGLPTYRGVGGLYEDADTEEGMPIEVALSGHMLSLRPEVAWKHIAMVEQACRGARPNRGHEIIARLQERMERVWVLTQNVDGFHGDAGSQNLIEIHGNVHHLRCVECDYRATVADYSGLEVPPSCPRCGALVRPDVVLFGEMLSMDKLGRLNREMAQGFDIVFSVGTTSGFPYIAAPVLEARARGWITVEINPGQSEVSEVVEYRLRSGAKDSLEAIWQHLTGSQGG